MISKSLQCALPANDNLKQLTTTDAIKTNYDSSKLIDNKPCNKY